MDRRAMVRVSFEGLGSHRMRTLLTMLGGIFGVAAVVSMLAIGEGARRDALEQISTLGIDNIIVNAKVPEAQTGAEESFQRSRGLALADGENIALFEDLVTNVVPQRFEPLASVRRGSREVPARVVSTFPRFLRSSAISVERGRFLVQSDIDDNTQVCVLGSKVRRSLFAFEDPIGTKIRIGDLDYTVVGYMTDTWIGRGKVEGLELKNLNEDVYIPYTTALRKVERTKLSAQRYWGRGRSSSTGEEQAYNTPEIDQLTVTVTDVRQVPAAARLIERVLERRHGGVRDYEIVVPESLLQQARRTHRVFSIVTGAIAGLSLLVGGIGIMNIMLASVLERTREIGVRRAVGATRGDIQRQFLLEAVAICLVGCAIGLGLGVVLSRVVSLYAGWPTVISLFSIILSVGVATLVGLIFGVYPARKAASLDVIDALRYE